MASTPLAFNNKANVDHPYNQTESAAYAAALPCAAQRMTERCKLFASADELAHNGNMSHAQLCQLATEIRASADNIVSLLVRWADSFGGHDGVAAHTAAGPYHCAHPSIENC